MTDSRSYHFVSDGKVPTSISIAIRDAVAAARGKRLKLTLSLAKKYSSDHQREYYFAVIVQEWMQILRGATDRYWDEDETHEYLMEEVGGWFKPLEAGQKRPRRRSYTDLNTVEAERHHTLCRAAAAAEGHDIPEPNEKPKGESHESRQEAPATY